MQKHTNEELKKALRHSLLTIVSSFILAIILHEPELLKFVAKSVWSALLNVGIVVYGGLKKSSENENLLIEKKHKRHIHGGNKKSSRWKKRKAKNRKR
jgi:hypothetical protein